MCVCRGFIENLRFSCVVHEFEAVNNVVWNKKYGYASTPNPSVEVREERSTKISSAKIGAHTHTLGFPHASHALSPHK